MVGSGKRYPWCEFSFVCILRFTTSDDILHMIAQRFLAHICIRRHSPFWYTSILHGLTFTRLKLFCVFVILSLQRSADLQTT